jgi:hypothetical protein
MIFCDSYVFIILTHFFIIVHALCFGLLLIQDSFGNFLFYPKKMPLAFSYLLFSS